MAVAPLLAARITAESHERLARRESGRGRLPPDHFGISENTGEDR